ncbi:MAG: hypothetical protein US83_C0007G0051 [Candidatus Falkowbacteria bacterium GW2011_GWC2_38_22]|uniref:Type 4 fimbrial biogenesis protein PilX N-terminal domain-containing protein n=1 Tax=Candidatus Falkowbacteria bacterium GW2011_GWE1_38_31 TaxID=1618638 RepID=A0A0G0MY83_9BACT|nr:MAG: hypothetical protein US73_C0008G0006 [Candidatus Falkowbacteria bacterium GW2011_GWF2_38_1205]KKQ61315.1 MAG: hypothetical protein US83_C0007G0051 [Candidatus Falkowbacteria bacterium GW2011_GWC2_38_22]KKQ63113.1 MAG: hypothetical protein US84_C0008G0006 [Candidatus Falkowbacteria bacterium GW2011_GWF1_38_22]KKQ65310.1 MAG: hypothetical protein US87_C0008G0006 [Candidatus Falkowbacteria bacterium GW2011_GWE2_38_254]KKQ69886.1 MAG: hypothetical protein US91_C0008G0006 [Candidatus Falkowb
MTKNILKSQTGSAMLVMTFFVLTSVLIISLSLSAIVVNGLHLGTDQVQSTKAFFAAEAGAERILWEFRKNKNDPIVFVDDSVIPSCNNNEFICFDSETDGVIISCNVLCPTGRQKLLNETYYSINYSHADPITTLISYGKFSDVNRVIELKF